MNPINPSNSKELLTLQEAALQLAVSTDVLLKWNEHNILKPTITQAGQIGYSQEQIDQFLYIRKINSATFSNQQVSEPDIQYNTNEVYKPLTSSHSSSGEFFTPRFAPVNPPQEVVKSGSKLSPVVIISSFTVVLFIIFVAALLIQQSNLNSLALQNKSSDIQKDIGLKSSSLPSERIIVALPIQLDNNDKPDDTSIKNETVSKDKITELTDLYTNTNQGTTSAKPDIVTIPTTTKARIAQLAAKISSNSALYKRAEDESSTNVTTYASSNTCENCDTTHYQKNSAIDEGGNIIGETSKSQMLATSLGGLTSFSNDSSSNSPASNSNVLIFLSVSALAGIFLLQKQLTNSMKSLQFAHSPTPQGRIDFVAQKILEVEQKMDGTVVLIFQGAEYKICKPELYSESDRFIERLMALSGTDVKEMDYDSMKDGKIRLSSPLSRLVTRLGFVGIKRELFFPRTSKDRVLFRKFLTRDDLKTMGLTPEQVANELFQSPPNDTI